MISINIRVELEKPMKKSESCDHIIKKLIDAKILAKNSEKIHLTKIGKKILREIGGMLDV